MLLTTLRHLDFNKFFPVVYCIEAKGEIGKEIEGLGVNVHMLNERAHILNLRIAWKLFWAFRSERPDILHSGLFYPNYFGRIAALLAGIPVRIITEHGTYSNFKRFYHFCIDFVLSVFTTKIIAVSEAVKEYLSRHSGIPRRRVAVVYNAVDSRRFDEALGKDRGSVRRQLGLSDNALIIGSVSNLAPWKGQLVLLQAFDIIANNFPEAQLVIAGRDALGFQRQLEFFAARKKLEKNVFFLGERRDIPEILRALDIFIFPSLTEGLGISLLEAMYMGLPVIASSTEGILEVVRHNRDGVLIPAGDYRALARQACTLLGDQEKMQQFGRNAREKIKQEFSPEIYIERLESLYKGN